MSSNQNCTSLGEMIYVAGWLVTELEQVRMKMPMENRVWLDQAIDRAADLAASMEAYKSEQNEEFRRYYRLGKTERKMNRKAGE